MGCNCKNKVDLIEKKIMTRPENETIFGKIGRILAQAFFFTFAFASFLVITPMIVFYAIYKVVFKGTTTFNFPQDKVEKFLKKNG